MENYFASQRHNIFRNVEVGANIPALIIAGPYLCFRRAEPGAGEGFPLLPVMPQFYR